jgi:hypothetical protein
MSVTEDRAEQITRVATEWVCRVCKRNWGEGRGADALARNCCKPEPPCQRCGGKTGNRAYELCRDCCWAVKPKFEWDGSLPLCVWEGDRYFWSDEDVTYWLDDLMDDDPNLRPEDVRLVLCEPCKVRGFEMGDYLSDDLPEDDDTDFSEIDRVVNDWIKANVPASYYSTGKAVSAESVRKYFWREEWNTPRLGEQKTEG